MRWVSGATIAVLTGSVLGVAPVRADHMPVLVVPGRPDVPVVINGHDASWATVEGDWGLYRPGHVTPTVTYPYRAGVFYGRPWGYFPATGRRPRAGRLEVIPPPNRRLPEPAESFHRYWSTQAEPTYPGADYPPLNPPPVITAPQFDPLAPQRSARVPPLRRLD
jgi:hypothetical protein